MTRVKLYKQFARLVHAWSNNGHHEEVINKLIKNYLPSGSGIIGGTKIELDRSTSEKLVFRCCYHHMNKNGYYDGWTDHTIIVRASLTLDMDIKVTGPNRDDIKDYLAEVFEHALSQEVEQV